MYLTLERRKIMASTQNPCLRYKRVVNELANNKSFFLQFLPYNAGTVGTAPETTMWYQTLLI